MLLCFLGTFGLIGREQMRCRKEYFFLINSSYNRPFGKQNIHSDLATRLTVLHFNLSIAKKRLEEIWLVWQSVAVRRANEPDRSYPTHKTTNETPIFTSSSQTFYQVCARKIYGRTRTVVELCGKFEVKVCDQICKFYFLFTVYWQVNLQNKKSSQNDQRKLPSAFRHDQHA